jgi:hypothetical protein
MTDSGLPAFGVDGDTYEPEADSGRPLKRKRPPMRRGSSYADITLDSRLRPESSGARRGGRVAPGVDELWRKTRLSLYRIAH